MLAETIPASEFGYPNSVLAKTAPFFLQSSRSFTAPVCPQRYCRLVRCMRHFSPAEVSSPCLLIHFSRCNQPFDKTKKADTHIRCIGLAKRVDYPPGRSNRSNICTGFANQSPSFALWRFAVRCWCAHARIYKGRVF